MQIADELRRQIKAGRYQPGDRLPSVATMATEYHSATETVRNALRALRDEGVVATQSTRGTFVLRAPGEAKPDPEVVRLESEIRAAEARLAEHFDGELAKLREELEYTQAQVMALERQQGDTAARDVGS
jgi:DNA-binding GntR family transcriptional regulator